MAGSARVVEKKAAMLWLVIWAFGMVVVDCSGTVTIKGESYLDIFCYHGSVQAN